MYLRFCLITLLITRTSPIRPVHGTWPRCALIWVTVAENLPGLLKRRFMEVLMVIVGAVVLLSRAIRGLGLQTSRQLFDRRTRKAVKNSLP